MIYAKIYVWTFNFVLLISPVLYTLSSILYLLKKVLIYGIASPFTLLLFFKSLWLFLVCCSSVSILETACQFPLKKKTEKRKPGWAWFDHDSVGHLERIRVIILSLLIHEHVICLILSPLNVLIKFYNHQRDLEHCMYKYIY